mmetsp:Transcript_1973/g.4859  ORF Transcript_1973/g.4859 Transcript_1973/m.4859 type:complete len:1649 (-) Transcript_1973:101-5047(-)|eukprot:CAMPEP_0119563504 /NCGR_PEP_ID=MMETSP1352-20130426/23659_1 /TAXON_ID=265584 /ORGANISM="Stauroneis constricta, Strain CCMP1120" /LENGTH=1648 /DNA_ID=CAMNT_0007612113 /DNA_START=279 /DNA_END=5225 /DNA_ORIENTATION=-
MSSSGSPPLPSDQADEEVVDMTEMNDSAPHLLLQGDTRSVEEEVIFGVDDSEFDASHSEFDVDASESNVDASHSEFDVSHSEGQGIEIAIPEAVNEREMGGEVIEKVINDADGANKNGAMQLDGTNDKTVSATVTPPSSTASRAEEAGSSSSNGSMKSVELDGSNNNTSAAVGDAPQTTSSAAAAKANSKEEKLARSSMNNNSKQISLEDQASCLGRWTLSFMNPLLQLGSQKVLEQSDVGAASEQDRAERAYTNIMREWTAELEKAEKANKVILAKHKQRMASSPPSAAKATGDEKKDAEEPKKPALKEASMTLALMRAFGVGRVMISMTLYVVSSLLNFVPVLILNDLVRYFEYVNTNDTTEDSRNDYIQDEMYAHPWAEVVALGVTPLLTSILQTRYNGVMAHCGVFVRTAVSTMLYQKSLRVSAAARAKTSTGQVVNMMSNDTMQLQRFLQFAGFTMVAPLQIILALVLIFQQVGNATWVGVAYMVFLAPVNGWVFSVVANMRREVLKYSDLRVKMMNEILTGIRILKFYAWERPFGSEVGRLRQKELEALTRLSYTTAVGFSIILLSTPIVQPIIVFLTYVNIQDEPLSAATAFTTVALFNIMRFPFAFMPMGLLQYIQSRISVKRLEKYLSMPELASYVMNSAPPPPSAGDIDAAEAEGKLDDTKSKAEPGSITIQNGTFSWIDPEAPEIEPIQSAGPPGRGGPPGKGGPPGGPPGAADKKQAGRRGSRRDSKKGGGDDAASVSSNVTGATEDGTTAKAVTITLQNLTCHIPSGSLVAVVGSVGCGKSSFLSAILGEMEPIHDSKVYMPRPEGVTEVGYASYCTQSPWVVNDTLRGNILFGREFDQARYDEVIEACALLDDLAVLPAGDKTEIGERGINLSGGQKARVSLARAMYSSNTKVLLMDDPLSAVDAHVGEHIFEKAICGAVSTGTTRILVTHHVHVLSRCDSVIVLDQGTIQHQGTFKELLAKGVDFAGAIDVSKDKSGEAVDPSAAEASTADEKVDGKTEKDGAAGKEPLATGKEDDKAAAAKADMKKKGEKLTQDEEKAEGSIGGSAYGRYAKAGGYCLAMTVVLVQALGRTAEIMASFWLALWAERMIRASVNDDPFTNQETSFHLGIYALFGFLGILGLGFRGIFVAMHRLKASKVVHDGIAHAILRAPVAFFDVTPIGRILNRFAADMDKLDLELTQTISQGLTTGFQIIGAVGGIVAATKGTFLAPLVPFGLMYYFIQKWFRKSSTELQRVTSIANSPIFTDFSQTLSGTSTIRAYGVQVGFFEKCKTSFDNMNASYILVQMAGYWLALRLDAMGGLIAMFIGAIAVGTLDYEFIPAGWLGLALSYSIEVTSYLKFGVQMIARLEADMSSVERILYYADNIEPEAPAVIPDKDPKAGSWPIKGEIVMQNLSMRYRDGPLVLKNLSLTVKGGEKIGVCGRTGSGKSSLMIALFRISEIESDGRLLIDGVDTKQIGTEALRMNLSIIPQDPVMFSNTVRYNLDPFKRHSDDEIWSVLEKVRMNEAIEELPNALEEEVAEGGENFSQGQRQLLCIARSLLRKPKILVMDEATASIDNETDGMIQEMIRENFTDATVLTIAHRLNTIMDSDRILVLDDGNIAEWDTPQNLLAKEDGHFKAMVTKSRDAQNNDH